MSETNRRQFIISNKKVENEEFLSVEISGNKYLSYHKSLKIQINGKKILLGYAYNCDRREKVVLDDDSIQRKAKWAGRWVLICDEMIYMDACGSLGLFYSYDTDNSIVCSSSIALLKKWITDTEWCSDYKMDRGDPPIFDYYPGPYTPVKNIMALLPSQYIDLSTDSVMDRSDFDFGRFQSLEGDEIVARFFDSQKKVLHNIADEFGTNIWLPLTGGIDSRTLFAMLRNEGLRFGCYTIKRPDTYASDINIPKQICETCNVEYLTFKVRETFRGKEYRKRIYDIESHCGGATTRGTEIGQYLNNIDVPESDKAIVLWGTVWEMGARFFGKHLGDTSPYSTDLDLIKETLKKMGKGKWRESTIHTHSIDKWTEYIMDHPVKGIGWADRLYWEQRLGAWLKYSYQMYDMFDSVRISPVNCQELLELMVSYNNKYTELTFKKDVQVKMINEYCPEIADIPYGINRNGLRRIIVKRYRAFRKRLGM